MENIQENNKLIAEFMGYNVDEIKFILEADSLPHLVRTSTHLLFLDDEDKKETSIWDFIEFHNSWDWLMPVVEKIEKLPNEAYGYEYYTDSNCVAIKKVVGKDIIIIGFKDYKNDKFINRFEATYK